jgi:hypothetical protein
MRRAVLVLLAACGAQPSKHDADYLSYTWDDRDVLCSDAIDDIESPVNWDFIDKEIALAARDKWALILHAHTPGVTVTRDSIERALSDAEEAGLEPLTFRDLQPGQPRAALALAFDDNAPDQWFTIRDLLAKYNAHVTFFVARYTEMTPLGHEELQMLYQDGNDLEPHTVNHLHGPDYVAQHGMQAYLDDEVLPSFKVLTDAGYPSATAFAYPFGEHTGEMDLAVLQYVSKVRTTPGPCPW